MSRPILCLDFDGTIHDYRRGWQDGSIYGGVTEGFFDWATDASRTFDLRVLTSRARDAESCEVVREWLHDKYEEWCASRHRTPYIQWVVVYVKPKAFLSIDDRAIRFEGDWKRLPPDILRSFRPWYDR